MVTLKYVTYSCDVQHLDAVLGKRHKCKMVCCGDSSVDCRTAGGLSRLQLYQLSCVIKQVAFITFYLQDEYL